MQNNPFKLIMISAMYENGGNTTQRLLDGHPQLFVYPFESQLGTKFAIDQLSATYPSKYRWPIFPSSFNSEEIYNLIIDEECKVRANTPFVSKFKDADFVFSEKERKNIFLKLLKNKSLSRANIIEAYFVATKNAWKNYKKSGLEKYYVGYSPIIAIDADKIIKDYSEATIIHIIRNPFSAYADTKKRPLPLSLENYILGWVICQYYALTFPAKFPRNFFIIRYEDIIDDYEKAFSKIFKVLKLKNDKCLGYPSWNKEKIDTVYPWGTIRIPNRKVNIETALTLNKKEIREIYLRTKEYLRLFNFDSIYQKIK